MTTLLQDDGLLDDMANALSGLRGYFMVLAEQHPEMDTAQLDRLLARYEAETGRKPRTV